MALVLVPAALLALQGWDRRWVAEDAFIDLRVVRNLLDGYGPIYNVGERVEVYTNPLWVGLLAATAALLRALSGEGVSLEWIAAVWGLLCATGGLALGTLGALRALRVASATSGRPALPLGALVVAAIPVYWDFATSGLETGLALGWLGLCHWGLAAFLDPRRRPRGGEAGLWAVIASLGPLIRPDLAVMSVGFLILLLVLAPPAGLRRSIQLLASAAALPAPYQIFRMGYFAAVVPNTALAKEAAAARWDQGLVYLADFVGPYALWLPLAVLGTWWLGSLVRAMRLAADVRGRALAFTLIPVLSGLAHGAYVVRLGGDFMHGRMLLPSLFAVLLPVAVVAGARWWHAIPPATAVVAWAVLCALWLRPPYHRVGNGVGTQGIADERWFYVHLSGHPHPVTLADYDAAPWARDGHALRRLAGERRVLLPWRPGAAEAVPGRQPELPLAPWVLANVVANRQNIGLTGYAAGPRVHLVDRLGLGDPIASRLRLERRRRPGHEKDLPDEWVVARFAAGVAVDPVAPAERVPPLPALPRDVVAARAALTCSDLAELLRAVQAPLTPDRFLRNVALAWRLSTLRLPRDPLLAERELCRSQEPGAV
jgi:arabinofuranosyltransferase